MSVISVDRDGVFIEHDDGYVRSVQYDQNGDDTDASRRVYAERLAEFLNVPAKPTS